MSGCGFHWSPCGGGGGDRFALGALVALGLLIVGVVGAARAVWHAIGPAVTEAAEVTALVLISATGAAALAVLALLVRAARRRVLARIPAPAVPVRYTLRAVPAERPCPNPSPAEMQVTAGQHPATLKSALYLGNRPGTVLGERASAEPPEGVAR